MSPIPAVYVAYTGQINPPGATPVLTQEQVWSGLQIKVSQAEDFLPMIDHTDIISRSEDDLGRQKTVRDIVFKEGGRRVREEVIELPPTKIVFLLPSGGRVHNIISEGANDELYLTYDFEWLHEGMSKEDLAQQKERYTKMSKTAVESSIHAMREMVKSGKIA